MRQRRTIVLSMAALAVALTLAGCGSSKKKTAESTSTTTTSPAATPGTAAGASDDAATAKTINIQASDFPAGWTPTPASPETPQDKSDQVQLNSCLGLAAPDAIHTADIKSDSFQSGASIVSSSVTMAKTASDAKKELAAYKSSKAETCLREGLNVAIARQAQGATLNNVTLTPQTPPPLGDGSFAYKFSATISAQGQQQQINSDVLGVLVDRAELSLTSVSGTGTVPSQLQLDLLNKMVARAKNA